MVADFAVRQHSLANSSAFLGAFPSDIAPAVAAAVASAERTAALVACHEETAHDIAAAGDAAAVVVASFESAEAEIVAFAEAGAAAAVVVVGTFAVDTKGADSVESPLVE